jgi:hypothetical protein
LHIIRAKMLVGTGVEHDAIVSSRGFYRDEAHAGGSVRGAMHARGIHAFVAIEAEGHVTKRIRADLGDESYAGAEARAPDGLIGPLSAVVDAVATAEECLAFAGQALHFHGEACRVAANDRDARLTQKATPAMNGTEEPVSLPQRVRGGACLDAPWADC